MKQVAVIPKEGLPERLDPEIVYFTPYNNSHIEGVNYFGLDIPRSVKSARIKVPIVHWDFATIAFSVDAADKSISRESSEDGWTRVIELTICLVEPEPWNRSKVLLEDMLGFLSGDVWKLNFLVGGCEPPNVKNFKCVEEASSVSLLSGGVDSLVGAIDYSTKQSKTLLISHIVRMDRLTQQCFARRLNLDNYHLQWSFSVKRVNADVEISTRARSIVFFAYAILASALVPTLLNQRVQIVVPENGFISLNIPLGPGRMGSLSTKTTHPYYLGQLQKIWERVGIFAEFDLPYQFKTKGEILQECRNQALLKDLVGQSSSCGRGQRVNAQCGVCVPCLVRRAAFHHAGLSDTTEPFYQNDDLSIANSVDISAASTAYIRYTNVGIDRFVAGHLNFADSMSKQSYKRVVERGLKEIGNFLSYVGKV